MRPKRLHKIRQSDKHFHGRIRVRWLVEVCRFFGLCIHYDPGQYKTIRNDFGVFPTKTRLRN